jgi:hypothetical protein
MADEVGTPRGMVYSRGYDIQLVIKDYDYTSELFGVRVISSVTAPYQIVTLDILIDPEEILKENVFSKDPLKLSIRLEGRGTEKITLERLDMELMYLKTSYNAAPQVRDSMTSQRDRSLFRIITVPRKPFKTITTLVNDVFIGQPMREIIQTLVGKTDASLNFTSTGVNTEPIDQIVIPPTTLYKAILYLDETFGIFDGMLEVHCNLNNDLHVHNLSKEINKDQTFGIFQIPLDVTKEEMNEIFKQCNDGKNFYTYAPLKSDFSGNTKFSLLAKQTKHLTKPKDELYNIIDKNLDDVTSEYGIVYKYDKVLTDPITNRTKYYVDHLGYQNNETFINARLSKYLSNITTVSVEIEKNLRILNLLNVGEPVKLMTKNFQYVNLAGKYILKNSDISFTKSGEWFPTCKIDLFRSNNTI